MSKKVFVFWCIVLYIFMFSVCAVAIGAYMKTNGMGPWRVD